MIIVAILKHIASKNANYNDAVNYMKYQYNELTMEPIRDKDGYRVFRDWYKLDVLNCRCPGTFYLECKQLNDSYNKNRTRGEVKSHHYIISFDPKDQTENGLTGEQAQALALEFAKKNFPGHQALVCTHLDGHNGIGNIHSHIIINSVRKLDVEHQDFMESPRDSRAGYKHHLSRELLVYLKKDLMEMCQRENLCQIDLLLTQRRKSTTVNTVPHSVVR